MACRTARGRASSYLDWVSFFVSFDLALRGHHLTSSSCRISINRLGGHGQITKVHSENGAVTGLDVKYFVNGGADKMLSPELVKPHKEMEPGRRRRRTIQAEVQTGKENSKKNASNLPASPKKNAAAGKSKKTKRRSFLNLLPLRKKGNKPPVEEVTVKVPKEEPEPMDVDEVPQEVVFRHQSVVVSPLIFGEDFLRKGKKKQRIKIDKKRATLSTTNAQVLPTEMDEEEEVPKKNPPQEEEQLDPVLQDRMEAQDVRDEEELVIEAPTAAALPVSTNLRQIYEKEKKEAKDFIDDVMAPTSSAPSATNKKKVESSTKPNEIGERFNRFVALLRSVLQMDEEEDGVEEDQLLPKVNSLLAARHQDSLPFDQIDFERYLVVLCNENKIMRYNNKIFYI